MKSCIFALLCFINFGSVSIRTVTKNIQKVYLYCAPALRTVKKWLGRFCQGDYNKHLTTLWVTSLFAIIVNISTAFCHLKQLGFKKNARFWKIEKVSFCNHDNARLHAAKQTLQNLKELKWDPLLYSSNLAPLDFHLFWYLFIEQFKSQNIWLYSWGVETTKLLHNLLPT